MNASREPQQSKLRLKDKRQRLMWVKVASGASVVLVALVLVWFAARLPDITISNINISAKSVEEAALEDIVRGQLAGSYFFFIPRLNSLALPKGDIVAAVAAAFPEVENVSVTRDGLQGLAVSVSEREEVALWCENESSGCYSMDRSGFVFGVGSSQESGVLVHFSGLLSAEPIGVTFLDGEFAALKTLVEEISSTVRRIPESVLVEENGDATITFRQGGELRFVRSADAAVLIDNIAAVFGSRSVSSKETLEYADFRFGDKVYVKFREQ